LPAARCRWPGGGSAPPLRQSRGSVPCDSLTPLMGCHTALLLMALPSPTPEREHWSDSSLGRLALSDDRVRFEANGRLREVARERRRRERRAERERGRRLRAGVALALLVGGTFLLGAAGSGDITRWPPADRSGVSKPSKPSPALDPTSGQIASASAYLRTRPGPTSFALVDSRGRLHGVNVDRPFASASLLKATILAAYLNLVERRGGSLREGERAELAAMIRRSDNRSATRLIRIVGEPGLLEVARRVGMRDFKPMVVPWGLSQITARDQALLFARLERALPPSHHRLARDLLARIDPEQRWGLPQGASVGSRVLFKGGWAPAPRGGWRVHQAGAVERGGQKVALAVLSEGNPSQAHGEETIRGVSERLLR
jgi:hypothetical protein